MRVRALWLIASLVLALCPLTWAQGEEGMDPEAMERMMPGPEHEALAKQVGTWSVTSRIWLDPAAEPTQAVGTAEFTMIADGRFLHQVYKGEMMGMPFTGWGYDGFDRVTGKYTAYWMDSMNTSPMYLTGTSKDGGKTVEYTGDMSDWGTGTVMKARWVATHTSDDESHVVMYVTHEDKETKAMELDYTRKK